MRSVLLVLAVALALSGCAAGSAHLAKPLERGLAVPGAGLSLRYPVGWAAEAQPAVEIRGSSGERLRVGSFRPPEGPRDHPHARLPAGGAFILLYENDHRVAHFDPPRPAHFSLGRRMGGAFSCMTYPWPGYTVRFRDHGRSFMAVVALGGDAGVVTRLRVLRALDSIRVSPLPSDSERT
jgi:uncharacterized protein YceK